MLAYIIRRLFLIVPTLFGIMVINFIIVQAAPGGPVEQMIAQIQGIAVEATARVSGTGGGEVRAGQTGGGDSKYRGARGLDPDLIRRENEEFAPPADVLFYLAIPAELAGDRIEGNRGAERDLFEKEEYLRKVQAMFDAMQDPQLVRVDATADADAVFVQLWEKIGSRLKASA